MPSDNFEKNEILNCPSVVSWLDQFPESDRALASLSLTCLRFATTNEVTNDLLSALSELIDETITSKSKLIIESIVSKEDIERHLKFQSDQKGIKYVPLINSIHLDVDQPPLQVSIKAQKNIGNQVSHKSKESWPTHRLYEHFYPSEVRDEESGSEKYLDLVIRDEYERRKREPEFNKNKPILRGRSEIGLLADSNQDVHLILLTDNIGSGAQIVDFLSSTILACTTGVLAGRRVSISVISWTATSQGIQTIQEWTSRTPLNLKNTNVSRGSKTIPFEIRYLNETKSFFDIKDIDDHEKLLDFFQKYGDPKKRKASEGLGYGKTASRTVMLGSSCPNNVPDFLYAPAKAIGSVLNYRPIFKSKRVPDDLRDLVSEQYKSGIYNKVDSSLMDKATSAFLKKMENQRLKQAALRPGTKDDPRWNILLLAVAKYDKWDAVRLLSVPYFRFRRAESSLIDLKWINSDFSPTDKGIEVVKNYGAKGNYSDYAKAKRYLKEKVDGRDILYYPHSLRGVR
ncbi:hypothetical protein [Kocuria sp. CCUG 69068]|uniref:phosphoribosyltransferase-like protein n=1 Tax=Kocuria sp. CCUG 69068 TaxID=2043138 RepID=UPI001E375DD1